MYLCTLLGVVTLAAVVEILFTFIVTPPLMIRVLPLVCHAEWQQIRFKFKIGKKNKSFIALYICKKDIKEKCNLIQFFLQISLWAKVETSKYSDEFH